MSKSPIEYIKHIHDEIEYLLVTSSDITEHRFMHDETLQRAFARSISIIGEATKKLPSDFRTTHSKIDWKAMAGMRDRLIHDYFGIDYAIVWDVVKNELPRLKTDIQHLIDLLQSENTL